MHFTTLLTAALAVAEASAVAVKTTKSTTTTAKATVKPTSIKATAAHYATPLVIKDRKAAVASVLAVMSARKPKSTNKATTLKVTGSSADAKTSTVSIKSTSTKTLVSTATASKATVTKTKDGVHARAVATCASEPGSGYTYVPNPSTMAGFLSDDTLYNTSLAASPPAGYTWIYAGFYASLNQAGYIGYTSLSSYNQTACSAACDTMSGCAGFDIYFERDPVLNPGPACANPGMQTTVRCAFYNNAVNASYAVNVGEWRQSFGVVIAGANGYVKGATTSSGTTMSKASTTTSATKTSSTSSVCTNTAAAATSASCAIVGTDTTFNSPSCKNYQTKCGYDLTNIADISTSAAQSYTGCFPICDSTSGCSGFTFLYNSGTAGAGVCYLKNLTGVTSQPSAFAKRDFAFLPSVYTVK